MIVTTSTRGQEKLRDYAEEIAKQLNIPYIRRGKHSVTEMIELNKSDRMIMITTDGVKVIFKDHLNDPFFFHPNSAMFRLKRILKGEHDPFIETTQLREGMSFLDCTLGLASDAIIASHVVGSQGRAVGIESVSLLAYIVQLGLQSWKSKVNELDEAMRRVEVIQANHYEYLKQCPSSCFDIVYFDPMFEATKEESIGIAPLKIMADYQRLESMTITEAKRVAKHRVVLKESSYSLRFEELGFKPKERKYASHWFGTIELG
jgi:hypothetical protein